MKRFFTISLVSILLVLTACKKDEEKPLLVLYGSDEVTIELNSTWTDPGYTASDDQDGDITDQVVVSGDEVDTDMAGTYEIIYTVSDKAGNTDEESRVVYVVNSALAWGGLYDVIDTTDIVSQNVIIYAVHLIPSITENNIVTIQNFRSKGNNCQLDIEFQNLTQIIIDTQQPDLGVGNEADVSGAGQVLADNTSLRIGYLVSYHAGGSETGIMNLTRN